MLSICRKYYFRSYDNDDLYQETRIVCFKTNNSYDPQRQASFFISLNLQRHFCRLLRKEKTTKRSADSNAVSYEELLQNSTNNLHDHLSPYNIEEDYLSNFSFNLSLNKLSPFERKVLNIYLTTHQSSKEIALTLNLKITKIYHAMRQIKLKIKDELYS